MMYIVYILSGLAGGVLTGMAGRCHGADAHSLRCLRLERL